MLHNNRFKIIVKIISINFTKFDYNLQKVIYKQKIILKLSGKK